MLVNTNTAGHCLFILVQSALTSVTKYIYFHVTKYSA